MPCGASSRDSVLAQPATAPRTVFDTPSPAMGSYTEVETTLTIRPQPAARIPGTSVCTMAWLASTWRPKASTNAAASASSAGPPGGPPVLLTRMCTGAASASPATAPRSGSRWVTSPTSTRCRWLAPRGRASTTACSAWARRASTVTSAPSSASSCAAARPMPSDAPQTSAWRPERSRSIRAAPSVDVVTHQRSHGAAPGRSCIGERVGHRHAVPDRMLLGQLELEFDARRFEAEAGDAAQLAPVVLAIVLETPGLPDRGFEAVAHARDEVGKPILVLEHLQRARQMRHCV